MTVSEAKRLKALEDENAKLKKLLAEQMLNMAAMRELHPRRSAGDRGENARDHRGADASHSRRMDARSGPCALRAENALATRVHRSSNRNRLSVR